MRLASAVAVSTSAVLTAVMLTGCSGFTNSVAVPSAPGTSSLPTIAGTVMGGQSAIGYSTIQVWQVGSTGYGTGATALIPTLNTTNGYFLGGAPGCTASGSQTCYATVLTTSVGGFALSGDYTCTTGSELYITATGGQANPGNNNTAIAQLLGYGPCGGSSNPAHIVLNELATVASVYALQQFMPATGSSVTPWNVGSSSTNVAGLTSAFGDIGSLANVVTGSAVPPTSTVITPAAEVNTLADVLAACVNSNGPASSGCSSLFGYAPNADASTPGDTISAALNIARNPQRQVGNIIGSVIPQPPFQPTITSATDLTLAITYTGSGISLPTAVAVDGSGNVWVANKGTSAANSSVTELSHTGSVLSGASGYNPSSVLNLPSALAVDTSGNVWVANAGNSTLTELSSAGANSFTSAASAGGLSTPSGVAIDTFGDLWLSNSGANVVSEFSSAGTVLSGTTGYTGSGLSAPVGIAINPH